MKNNLREAPLCVLESMKMEMKISVPEELDGKEAEARDAAVVGGERKAMI